MRTPEVEAAMAWAVLAYNGDTIGEAAAELLRSLAIPDIDQFSDNTERQHDGALRTLAAEVERLEARVAVAGQSIDELQAALNTQQARVAELEEFRIMQLAAISTATLQNTVKSTADRISPGSPYSTVAYVDVCKAVDREMRERQRAEAAEARVKELEAEALNGRHAVFTDLKAQLAAANEQNARRREALERLDALYVSEFDHEDRPPRPQWLKAALNVEEAST